jgi:hypothetical protein
MRKKRKCETNHGKSENKNEFGNPWSGSLGFKCDAPIMLIPYSHLFDSVFDASFLKYFVDKEIQICIYHYFFFAYIHCDNYVIVCIINFT